MPIILITGANGHGKGQFAIKKILELQEQNDKREKEGKPRRPIYANIHGINAAGREPLPDVQPIPSDKIFFGKQDNPDDPPPAGYFVPPIGSIFFYDEAQKTDWIKQKAGALSTDPRVRSLEEHRHAGLDIYFITQSPNYIHSHIFDLVSPHYYVERPLGLKTTNVFLFNKPQKTPQAKTIKKAADDQFMIALGEKYGKYYQSSAEHNIKATIPLKIKIAVGFFLLVLALLAYKGLQTKRYYDERHGNTTTETQETTSSINNNSTTATIVAAEKSELEQLREKLELLKLKNQIEQQRRLLQMQSMQLPSDYSLQQNNPAVQVRAVVAKGNTCHAYNAYGNALTLDYSDCQFYLKEAGRVHKSANPYQPTQLPQESL